MTLHPRGLLAFLLFAVALAFALTPAWGVPAIAGFLAVELCLLLGIAGVGRNGAERHE